jgi:hypothetical protein
MYQRRQRALGLGRSGDATLRRLAEVVFAEVPGAMDPAGRLVVMIDSSTCDQVL